MAEGRDAGAEVERGEAHLRQVQRAMFAGDYAIERGAQVASLQVDVAAQDGGASAQVERGNVRVRCGDPLAGHGEAQPQTDGE